MYISGFNLVYVSNATFSSNKAGYGGAIYIAESVGKESFFSSCMFDGNEASDGGAVYLYTGTGVDTFTSSGFRANFASKCLTHLKSDPCQRFESSRTLAASEGSGRSSF